MKMLAHQLSAKQSLSHLFASDFLWSCCISVWLSLSTNSKQSGLHHLHIRLPPPCQHDAQTPNAQQAGQHLTCGPRCPNPLAALSPHLGRRLRVLGLATLPLLQLVWKHLLLVLHYILKPKVEMMSSTNNSTPSSPCRHIARS